MGKRMLFQPVFFDEMGNFGQFERMKWSVLLSVLKSWFLWKIELWHSIFISTSLNCRINTGLCSCFYVFYLVPNVKIRKRIGVICILCVSLLAKRLKYRRLENENNNNSPFMDSATFYLCS